MVLGWRLVRWAEAFAPGRSLYCDDGCRTWGVGSRFWVAGFFCFCFMVNRAGEWGRSQGLLSLLEEEGGRRTMRRTFLCHSMSVCTSGLNRKDTSKDALGGPIPHLRGHLDPRSHGVVPPYLPHLRLAPHLQAGACLSLTGFPWWISTLKGLPVAVYGE